MLIPRAAGAELAIYKAIDPFEMEYVKNDKVNVIIKDGVRYITKSGMRYITRDGMHYVVDDKYRLNMSMKIWHKKEKRLIGEYSPGDKIWWLTLFNPDYQGVKPCDFKVTYQIDFSKSDRDKKMFKSFMIGAKKDERSKWKFDKNRYAAKLVF